MVKWLQDAVFYEIYPQSFRDTNGDGIGDLPGITEKLDYIHELGCNALWLNPIYDSPFKDAGYDVRDYKKIAERYGTMEDLKKLLDRAHGMGMHVLLDLVPGHTSEEHAWFAESQKASLNEYSHRYIWTDWSFCGINGHPYIGGESERNGVYMLNFFKCQPALNYGWKNPTESWQKSVDDSDCLATREAIKDIICFWLEKGVDGFRVDMADSLVKEDDENKSGTCEVWRDILGAVRAEYPDAAFVSEWNNPEQSLLGAGFDMDFTLDWMGNGYNSLFRDYETGGEDNSFFRTAGKGSVHRFLEEYVPNYEKTKGKGYISVITGNHDTGRISANLTTDELKLAEAFILTTPGVPFLYYGDEIGMRYQKELPTKEGGYQRTGSRTPMQWSTERGCGFSIGGSEDSFYLPVDADAVSNGCTVEQQQEDPSSLLNTVKEILKLRHENADLQADADFAVICEDSDERPFVYRRGKLVLAVNPSAEVKHVDKSVLNGVISDLPKQIVYAIGAVEAKEDSVRMGGQSFAILAE